MPFQGWTVKTCALQSRTTWTAVFLLDDSFGHPSGVKVAGFLHLEGSFNGAASVLYIHSADRGHLTRADWAGLTLGLHGWSAISCAAGGDWCAWQGPSAVPGAGWATAMSGSAKHGWRQEQENSKHQQSTGRACLLSSKIRCRSWARPFCCRHAPGAPCSVPPGSACPARPCTHRRPPLLSTHPSRAPLAPVPAPHHRPRSLFIPSLPVLFFISASLHHVSSPRLSLASSIEFSIRPERLCSLAYVLLEISFALSRLFVLSAATLSKNQSPAKCFEIATSVERSLFPVQNSFVKCATGLPVRYMYVLPCAHFLHDTPHPVRLRSQPRDWSVCF